MKKALGFDDVALMPVPSEVNSRHDVILKSSFQGRISGNFLFPIFSSPMKGISNVEFITAMGENECLGFVHRFSHLRYREDIVRTLYKDEVDYGVAIGISDEEFEFCKNILQYNPTIICIDVANGYLKKVTDYVKKIKDLVGDTVPIMAGNVVTAEGTARLIEAGASFIRVGIGTGQLCTTRHETGIYIPPITALELCNQGIYDFDTKLVMDGGISNAGNAVKAFAAGADFVMIGSLFAYAKEADNNGRVYGMASRQLQEEFYGETKSIEGIEKDLDISKKRPLVNILKDFLFGIASACTYLNCMAYSLLSNAEFVQIKGE